MKKRFLLSLSLVFGLALNAQTGNVGINTDNPKAALDIKSHNNNTDKVLRFTTKPTEISTSDAFVFFVGKEVDGGYDLRRVTLPEIVKSLAVEVPSLRRISLTNSTRKDFSQRSGNYPLPTDKVIFNSSDGDYATAEGGIELKKAGVYEISAWVGFEQLTVYEGDIIISLAKKSRGESGFTNFKRAIISRSVNQGVYSVGNGVGASFSFIENFKAGDRIILQVNTVNTTSVNTLPGSVNLSATRVTKDDASISLTP